MTEELTNKELYRAAKKEFRVFLQMVWEAINLPEPTPLQYDIAKYLQYGPNKVCIEAFRGCGKSFITSAYVCWILLNDPQKKILVVSASKKRADNFTIFTLDLIHKMPILAHLKPSDEQRSSRIEFDVGPATPDQSPSVLSVGINSQITGSRADIIISDDVEVSNNSATVDLREKLLDKTKEFSAILKPLPDAKVIYLGTPQTEDSIYNKLPETFETRVWPALIPNEAELASYGGKIAPYILGLRLGGASIGSPTDAKRFSMADLGARQIEYGRTGFALQFMLSTQLTDLERYPLRVRDLIIMDIGDTAPMKPHWLPDDSRQIKDIPNLAMKGDRFYPLAGHSPEFSEFTGSVLAIDPSGRGKDETGYAVVKMLNGFLYVTRAGGLAGGYDAATLERLAMIAKEEKVNSIIVEANFGDGTYTELLKPVFAKVHPCQIEEVRHSTQKEKRIIDTLEPVMARHKLIIAKQVIKDDYQTCEAYDAEAKFEKSLIHQMTHITAKRGALRHDDRLDALAMGVNYWTTRLGQDADKGIAIHKERLLDEELRNWGRGGVIMGGKTGDDWKRNKNALFKSSSRPYGGGARL